MRPSWLLALSLLAADLGGLGCSEPTQTIVVLAPAVPTANRPSVDPSATAAPNCLTIRDAELGCSRRCDDLSSELRRCAQPGANGEVTVSWQWNTRQTAVTLDVKGSGMGDAADCVRARMERFVPCHDAESQQGTLPILFRPAAY